MQINCIINGIQYQVIGIRRDGATAYAQCIDTLNGGQSLISLSISTSASSAQPIVLSTSAIQVD